MYVNVYGLQSWPYNVEDSTAMDWSTKDFHSSVAVSQAQLVGWNWAQETSQMAIGLYTHTHKCRRPQISRSLWILRGTDEFLFHWFIMVYSQQWLKQKQCLDGFLMNLWVKTRIFSPKEIPFFTRVQSHLVPRLQEVARRARPLIWIGDLNVAADRVDSRRSLGPLGGPLGAPFGGPLGDSWRIRVISSHFLGDSWWNMVKKGD